MRHSLEIFYSVSICQDLLGEKLQPGSQGSVRLSDRIFPCVKRDYPSAGTDKGSHC